MDHLKKRYLNDRIVKEAYLGAVLHEFDNTYSPALTSPPTLYRVLERNGDLGTFDEWTDRLKSDLPQSQRVIYKYNSVDGLPTGATLRVPVLAHLLEKVIANVDASTPTVAPAQYPPHQFAQTGSVQPNPVQKPTTEKESAKMAHNKLTPFINDAKDSMTIGAKLMAGRAILATVTGIFFKVLPVKFGVLARITGKEAAIKNSPLTKLAAAATAHALATSLTSNDKLQTATKLAMDAALVDVTSTVDIEGVIDALVGSVTDKLPLTVDHE